MGSIKMIRIPVTLTAAALIAAALLVGAPPEAGATHYPSGSTCYDCHTGVEP